MKNRKDLTEYLFLDQPRIERYFQQLSAPVQYDKLPVWKVALGLTGLNVEGTQSRPGREFSFNEKLQKVIDHMQSENLLSENRPSLYNREDHDSPEKPFVIETLLARRARIEREGRALNIWVSLHPDEPSSNDRFPSGALYLIEDFRGDDEYTNMFSGYSSLWLLAEELNWLVDTPLDLIAQLRQTDDAMRHFASDPIGSLKSIGAQFGPERHIQTIYRFRASCVDMVKDSLTTIGYPLVISEV